MSGPDSVPHPARGRGVTCVLGPTNTGKTHLAIERLLGHESGVIGLPLRLLAREVYDKIVARIGGSAVALVTGEEKIKPASARYWVCTVEAMPLDLDPAFLAIDEVQLAADGERGHVFTDRLFHARGRQETLLLGASTMKGALADLLPAANFVARPRLSKLTYAGQKKLTRLPRRSAVVAFSMGEVYAIAELVRRQRGGAAVVLGALSPRTRNAQVELYQNGDVDFLVATDAIGMGLNLDVDHVAFASLRKFDGQHHRNLTPAETGQIAGRAGRHLNDGTFGVTGGCPTLDAELVERLEEHMFEPVKTLQWRSRALDFASLDALRESLRRTPSETRLTRARMVDDVIALETLSADVGIAELAKGQTALRTLWDMCQIPDYRKISSVSHAEMLGTLYRYVMTEGTIPEDWFARQVALADRTDGDLDTLATRLAHIRTWTFVSHRPDWLKDPAHWQERTRAIEDTLSDALHEGLMQRFVDRRTSVLMRRLRDKETLEAEIGDDGAIVVESHCVGHLSGFRFTPESSADSVQGKAARHAAAHVLESELAARAAQLSADDDAHLTLSAGGRVMWRSAEIGRLERGETALKPTVRLTADEHLSGPDRERVQKRLDDWLVRILRGRLGPLVSLGEAEDVTGLARGLAYRLSEKLGVLRRDEVADDVKALDQTARAQLRRYGLRFGAFNLYFPALLKPAATELLLALWTIWEGNRDSEERGPRPPRQGLTSAEIDPAVPAPFYRAAGYHMAGRRAVRIDMLERLADMIRPLIAWRATANAAAAPAGATGDGAFRVTPDMMSIVGCSGADLASILESLNFRKQTRPVPATAEPVAEQPATEAESDANAETATVEPAAEEAAPAASSEPPASAAEGSAEIAAEPITEEVWRPRRPHRPEPKTDARRGPRREPGAKPGLPVRKPRAPEDRHRRPAVATAAPKPKPRPAALRDSPFAALEVLRQRMAESAGE